ncbi:hypothetical protein KAW64_16395, partial [bacterium]|nr:hypothetical protein [bacterium]
TLAILSVSGPDSTIIDCQQMGRAFILTPYELPISRIVGFTVVNGLSLADSVDVWGGYGGAIFCDDAPVELSNMVFRNNTGELRGGAMYIFAGGPHLITDCVFEDNTTPRLGGALATEFPISVILERCAFTSNTSADWGGALYAFRTALHVYESVFQGNTSEFGGAVNLDFMRGTPSFDATSFRGNWAGHHGGAASCSNSDVSFADCDFVGNSARYFGGAVGVRTQACEFERCTFFRNEAREHDGAVIATSRSSIISDCTFAYNSTPGGAAIVASGDSQPVITNTILAFNEQGPGLLCADTSVPEVSFSCSFGNAATDSLCGVCYDNIYLDPALCDTARGSLALQDCSPCIGAGVGGTTIGARGVACPCGDATGLASGAAASSVSLACAPNPATHRVVFRFEVDGAPSPIALSVYSAGGRLVRQLCARLTDSRSGSVAWDCRDSGGARVASGVYFVRLGTRSGSVTDRVVLLE